MLETSFTFSQSHVLFVNASMTTHLPFLHSFHCWSSELSWGCWDSNLVYIWQLLAYKFSHHGRLGFQGLDCQLAKSQNLSIDQSKLQHLTIFLLFCQANSYPDPLCFSKYPDSLSYITHSSIYDVLVSLFLLSESYYHCFFVWCQGHKLLKSRCISIEFRVSYRYHILLKWLHGIVY